MIEAFLALLLEAQREVADDAVARPQADPFEHGRQVGVWQGLEMAKGLLLKRQADDEERDRLL